METSSGSQKTVITGSAIEAIIIVLLTGFTLWVSLRSCRSVDTSGYLKSIDSLSLIVRQVAIQRAMDSAANEKVVVSLHNKTDSLIAVIEKNKTKMDHYGDRILWLIHQSDSLKSRYDTAALLRNCDSLQVVADALLTELYHYRDAYDTLQSTMQGEIDYRDSIIAQKDALLKQVISSYSLLSSEASTAIVGWKKSEKGRQFNKTLARIFALTTLVFGVNAFIHK